MQNHPELTELIQASQAHAHTAHSHMFIQVSVFIHKNTMFEDLAFGIENETFTKRSAPYQFVLRCDSSFFDRIHLM